MITGIIEEGAEFSRGGELKEGGFRCEISQVGGRRSRRSTGKRARNKQIGQADKSFKRGKKKI